MSRMVVHPKLAFDDLRYPLRRPDLPAETEGFGSASQQRWQLCSLFGGQFRLGTGAWTTPKGLDPLSLGPAHPLAYCAWADSQRFCNLPLRPALLNKFPSTQPATFAPIVWWFCSNCSFHTVDDTT